MRENLTALSKILMGVHRSLLMYEARQQEILQKRTFTPHEMLNLSLNDANFKWLKNISDLIVVIDTKVDDKKVVPQDKDFLLHATEARDLFFPMGETSKEFHGKVMNAISFDSEIMIHLSMLRTFLKKHNL